MRLERFTTATEKKTTVWVNPDHVALIVGDDSDLVVHVLTSAGVVYRFEQHPPAARAECADDAMSVTITVHLAGRPLETGEQTCAVCGVHLNDSGRTPFDAGTMVTVTTRVDSITREATSHPRTCRKPS